MCTGTGFKKVTRGGTCLCTSGKPRCNIGRAMQHLTLQHGFFLSKFIIQYQWPALLHSLRVKLKAYSIRLCVFSHEEEIEGSITIVHGNFSPNLVHEIFCNDRQPIRSIRYLLDTFGPIEISEIACTLTTPTRLAQNDSLPSEGRRKSNTKQVILHDPIAS